VPGNVWTTTEIKFMGMMKDYLLQLQEQCSQEQFGQDAVEWAVVSGWITLTYNLENDVRTIMGAPNICPRCNHFEVPDSLKCDECGIDLDPKPRGQYDAICEAYRARRADLEEQTLQALEPLFAEIVAGFQKPVKKLAA
jgi:hypothetical protein